MKRNAHWRGWERSGGWIAMAVLVLVFLAVL